MKRKLDYKDYAVGTLIYILVASAVHKFVVVKFWPQYEHVSFWIWFLSVMSALCAFMVVYLLDIKDGYVD